jgi:hypothetical protein
MSGQWLYQHVPETKHSCVPGMPYPARSNHKSIWLCECGRRWRVSRSWDFIGGGFVWHRRRRPMGRTPKTT